MKSQAEKDLIKKHKKEHKSFENRYKQEFIIDNKPTRTDSILTGILPSEYLLEDEHAVHWNFLYVVDDNGGKVIRSDVKGNVLTLKNDLKRIGYKAENIYRCSMTERNLL